MLGSPHARRVAFTVTIIVMARFSNSPILQRASVQDFKLHESDLRMRIVMMAETPDGALERRKAKSDQAAASKYGSLAFRGSLAVLKDMFMNSVGNRKEWAKKCPLDIGICGKQACCGSPAQETVLALPQSTTSRLRATVAIPRKYSTYRTLQDGQF